MRLQPTEGATEGALARDTGSVSPLADRERVKLARKWAYLLSKSTYIPMSHGEFEHQLLKVVDQVFAAIKSEPFSIRLARGVGSRLVELRCSTPESLRCTVEILGKALLSQQEVQRVDRLAERIVVVLGVIAAECTEAIQRSTVQQQGDMKQALLAALVDAQRKAQTNEAQFRAVMRHSMSGVANTNRAGQLIQVNDALSELLVYRMDELLELSVFDVIHAEDMAAFRIAYHALIDGELDQLIQPVRLIDKHEQVVDGRIAMVVVETVDGVAQQTAVVFEKAAASDRTPEPELNASPYPPSPRWPAGEE